jgi:Tfp pilus assembly protein PilF
MRRNTNALRAGSTSAFARLVTRGLVAAAMAMTVPLVGCASQPRTPPSPYVTATEADRNTGRAEQLTRDAVALLDGDPVEAERILREAIAWDIYHGPAHNNLGVLCLRRGRLYEAANEFEWARKTMPGHPDPRFNLALTFERAGRTDEALAMYGTALEVYDGHIASVQAIARLQVKRGRADARTREFLDEIALRGESERWREWAKLKLAGSGRSAGE